MNGAKHAQKIYIRAIEEKERKKQKRKELKEKIKSFLIEPFNYIVNKLKINKEKIKGKKLDRKLKKEEKKLNRYIASLPKKIEKAAKKGQQSLVVYIYCHHIIATPILYKQSASLHLDDKGKKIKSFLEDNGFVVITGAENGLIECYYYLEAVWANK